MLSSFFIIVFFHLLTTDCIYVRVRGFTPTETEQVVLLTCSVYFFHERVLINVHWQQRLVRSEIKRKRCKVLRGEKD